MRRCEVIIDPLAHIHVAQLELQYEISPSGARRDLLRELRRRLDSLELFPKIGPPWLVEGLFHLTVLTHTVVYEVKGNTVHVLGVVDSRATEQLAQLARDWRPS